MVEQESVDIGDEYADDNDKFGKINSVHTSDKEYKGG